ncbi:MAG: AAA family ATPase, partial [Gammaproteobacteria bacterium]
MKPDTPNLDIPFYQPAGDEVAVFEHAWKNRLPLLIKG